MTIKILYTKLLDTIRFESQLVIDPGTATLILGEKGFDILHPEVDIPHLLHDTPMWEKFCIGRCLAEHDCLSVASNHAEIRWLTPESIVGETEFVSKIVGRCHHIPNEEDGGYCEKLSHDCPFCTDGRLAYIRAFRSFNKAISTT
jgi:hypothetical protein